MGQDIRQVWLPYGKTEVSDRENTQFSTLAQVYHLQILLLSDLMALTPIYFLFRQLRVTNHTTDITKPVASPEGTFMAMVGELNATLRPLPP